MVLNLVSLHTQVYIICKVCVCPSKEETCLITNITCQASLKSRLGSNWGSGSHCGGAIPCTVWSSWQHIAIARKGQKYRDSLEIRREAPKGLFRKFVELPRIVIESGGDAWFEWPRGCDGWKDEEIQSTFDRFGHDVDGCMSGVVSGVNEPIYKPWTFKMSYPRAPEGLSGVQCIGNHARCASRDTNLAGFYPEKLAHLILEWCGIMVTQHASDLARARAQHPKYKPQNQLDLMPL